MPARLYHRVSLFCSCLRLRCCPGSGRLGTERAASPAHLVPGSLQRGVWPPGQCEGAAAYAAIRASRHRRMTVPGLLSSVSGQRCWEAAAGHEKGAFGPRDSSKWGCFLHRCAHSLFLPCPACSSTSLELQRPGWHWPQHPKAAAAASPLALGEEPSQLLGRAGRPLPAYGGSRCWAAPGKAPGTRRVRHGQRAHASLLTPRRPRGPRSRLPPHRPGSHRALLLSWPEDLLAAGVKFPTGTHSPTGGGGSQVLARVSHPALLAYAFGLPLLLPWAPHQQKTM